MYEAQIVDAWEDVSHSGNHMMVLEWSYWSGDTHMGEVRQFLLAKIPGSLALLRRILRAAGNNAYTGPQDFVGVQAQIDVDDSGDWLNVTEVRVP